MKLPNGYGSITKLPGNRRKPYAVRKTVNGRQKYLKFESTFEKALAWLVDYNKSPSVLDSADLTFSRLYHLEMKERCTRIADTTRKNYDIAFKHCAPIHDTCIVDLKVSDLQAIIHQASLSGAGHPTQKKIRQVMHNVYNYAVKYQLIHPTANISQFVDIDIPRRKYRKKPFNTRQLNRVRAIADDASNPLSPWAMAVVMMCYCGTRPSEFIAILKQDVKLKSRHFKVRDSKTAAGRNRLVPISRKVLPYYQYWMNRPGKTLIADDDGAPLSYCQMRKHFMAVMKAARCNHRMHECRHTCATWLDDKGANKLAIKRILGHATQDITDGVYTHKSLHQLKKAIDLL